LPEASFFPEIRPKSDGTGGPSLFNVGAELPVAGICYARGHNAAQGPEGAPRLGTRASVTCAALQPQLLGPRLHGLYAEVDVLVERHAQLLRAIDNFLTVYGAREGFVLHLLLD